MRGPSSRRRRAGGPSRSGKALGALLVSATLAMPASSSAVSAPPEVGVTTVASGVGQPTNLAFDGRRRMWVSSSGHTTDSSDGVWLVERPGSRPRQVIRRLFSALGLVWHRGELYVSHVVPYATRAPQHSGRVTAFGDFDGRRFRSRRVVVDGVPTGMHRVDTLALGPDRRIYMGVGSQTDSEPPDHPLSAAVVSFRPDGGDLQVEGRGFRNPYGLAFIPETATLLVSDNGRDDLGLDRPPEELNALDVEEAPRSYGFPACFDQGGAACRGVEPPVARLPPHAAAAGVAVLGELGRYGPSAYVAQFGSSFAAQPTGGDIVRVPLQGPWEGSRPGPRRFVSEVGRQEPLGLVAGPDGALYVTLWSSGKVLRIAAPPSGAAARSLAGAFRGVVAPGSPLKPLGAAARALGGSGAPG